MASSDKSTNTSSNLGYNSFADGSWDKHNKLSGRGYSIEAQTFHIIDASEIELTPSEIARIIHSGKKPKEITPGQYSTVRVACTRLLVKGLVVQPYTGSYCNKITHGVRFVPLCVHNVTLLARVCQNLRSWVCDEFVGGVKLHVCFGKERKQVSGYIACDVGGMSHDACLLALNRWFEIVEGRLGYCLQDLVLQTVEFNKDYHGHRIDGFQCVTKSEMYGIIDRTYQKEEDIVRRERKVTQPMSINKFEAEIHKGIEEIGRSQASFELHREVKANSEALKFNNSRLLQVEKLTEAVFLELQKSPEKRLDNLEMTVQKFEAAAKTMAVSADKINEALSKLGDLESDPKRLVEGQKKLGDYVR
jgi:hypothetical protein